MTRQAALEQAKTHMREYLEAKGINPRKPFLCLNPEHVHTKNTPSMSFNPKKNKVHCFGGSCGVDWDIFDLIGVETGLTGAALFEEVFKRFNIQVDGGRPSGRGQEDKLRQKAPGAAQATHKEGTHKEGTHIQPTHNDYTHKEGTHKENTHNKATQATQGEDYEYYMKACQERLPQTSYLQERGISTATAERFGLGFDPDFHTRKAAGGYTSMKVVIIPTGSGSYVARNTDKAAGGEDRYRKRGPACLLNTAALAQERPVFVVEGELDAISLEEVGAKAIGLGSAANVPLLVRLLEKNPQAAVLILALDTDEAGMKATKELEEKLEKLNVPYIEGEGLTGESKDPNEALIKDRDGLKARAEALEQQAPAAAAAAQAARLAEAETAEASRQAEKEAAKEEELQEYLQTSAAYSLQAFCDSIATPREAISTGFANLDDLLDGGLFPGLYILGAVSSRGKTTFCLQVADQAAAAGHDVLIFSLEMAKEELMAKSLSRQTLKESMERRGDIILAKTTRTILNGWDIQETDEGAAEACQAAMDRYAALAGNLYIIEGVGNIGAEDIAKAVKEHIRLTDRRPLVLIDYLQILAPAEDMIGATDKQITDKNVLELKRLSRSSNVPVLAISSFNRENYTASVSMSAFKESGAIEYSSDVLLGLQLNGMDRRQGESDKDRASRLEDMNRRADEAAQKGGYQILELKVLKNRNGRKGRCCFHYFPMFNDFEEAIVKEDEEAGMEEE